MKAKSIVLVLTMLAMLIVGVIPALAADEPNPVVPFTVINSTYTPVVISLSGPSVHYLVVAAGATETFTLTRDVFDHTTTVCNTTVSGTMDMFRQLQLHFNTCASIENNYGEPGKEKTTPFDPPPNAEWQYQF
jgi:hypothetical protein